MIRRLAYVVITLLWLILMAFPIVAISLAFKGELRIGSIEAPKLRLFLVQENENQGIGLEWLTKDSDNAYCQEVKIRYLLWKVEAIQPNVNYCLCHGTSITQPASTGNCE